MEKFVLLAIIISCNVFVTLFDLVHGTSISSLCSQTRYPQLCNSLKITTTLDEKKTLDDHETVSFSSLRDTAIRVTLAQAEQAHKLISNMDLSSFNKLGKAAWSDCVKLYEDTIKLLNRSVGLGINGKVKPPSSNDAQTWLSAAFANQQTCLNGFTDFNLSSHHHLPMLSDFSKYLSNSLAINKLSSVEQITGGQHRRRLLSDGFPEWLSVADRKLLQSSSGATNADVVVAQDGSGDYRTISEALAAVGKMSSGGKRLVIYVKSGVYKENVEIKTSNLMFIGDGIDATIVTGSKNVQDGSTTFGSATFRVSGDGFIARSMTFENTAGPQKHQAVALCSSSDYSVFYSCSFRGYQDTLYVLSKRQFYRDCDIYGTIDFIFGDAVAVLQNCNIYIRKPLSDQKNFVTAQGRTDPNENTGIVIHNSHVTAASDLRAVQGSFQSYLGRPWMKYSRTVYMKSNIDSLIDPAGWFPWDGNFALSTLYFGEYLNSGGGADTSGRVKWPGYRVITSAAEAGKFSVGNFLAGNSWIPATGVPFTAGL